MESDEVYLRQVGDPAAGGDGVVHHGLSGEREERLGHVQRQRPEPRPFGGAANHDDGDDALLGARHGCSSSAERERGDGWGERGGGRAGEGVARFMATGFGARGAWTAGSLAEAMAIRRRGGGQRGGREGSGVEIGRAHV